MATSNENASDCYGLDSCIFENPNTGGDLKLTLKWH